MSDGDPILSLRGAGRTFATGGRSVEALHDISLDLFAGRLTVLQGPSGSGKTTLLHLAALLDSPDRGSVTFLGHTLAPGDARQAAAWRRRSIGMVFQRFYLLPHRTALQNVRFRFRYLDRSISVTRRRAQEALDSVGLTSVADTPARCLSGGEMQRVALARALAEPPHLLLADEPTGNLDPESAAQVIRLLCACRDRGIAVVVATHHPGWMEHADEAYRIEGGRLTALPPMARRPSPSPTLSPGTENNEEGDLVEGRRFRLAALWTDICDGLRSRPGRTGMAWTGLAIGWFALALSFGLLRGLQLRSAQLVAELGVHSAALVQTSRATEFSDPDSRLRRNRMNALRAAVPDVLWSGVRQRTVPLDARRSIRLVRTDAALAQARGWTIREGRWLDPEDERNAARHAVATAGAAQTMNWTIGDALSMEGDLFRLVGILEGGAEPGETSTDLTVAGEPALFIPWTAAEDPGDGAFPDTLDALHVQARDDASLHRAIERADRVLSAPDLAVSETAWITPDLLRQRLRRWRDAVAWGTGCLAALCLLLGGTGLMNLFFADVRNRMPEIGLRLSLGARPVEVAAIFLQEAFLISLAAVAAALLAAGPALHEVARQTGLPFALDVDIASRTILAALVFGALFSFLPARLAARVSAAEALRND